MGFFDLGIFLVAGFCQFMAGSYGVLALLLVFFVVDLRLRCSAGIQEGTFRRHLLLPRLGLSFVCMPMWIATLMFGVFGWLFPWQELGPAAHHVGLATFVVLALIAASFWFADYTYEIGRPN